MGEALVERQLGSIADIQRRIKIWFADGESNNILSLIGPGDEVVILAPYWVSYEGSVKFAGGTPVIISADVSEGYKAPASRIAAAITPATKLLILNSPCNPTGAVWTRAEMEAIAAIVRQHPKLMVLADEIYEYILFEGEMVSFGTLPDMAERTITLNEVQTGSGIITRPSNQRIEALCNPVQGLFQIIFACCK